MAQHTFDITRTNLPGNLFHNYQLTGVVPQFTYSAAAHPTSSVTVEDTDGVLNDGDYQADADGFQQITSVSPDIDPAAVGQNLIATYQFTLVGNDGTSFPGVAVATPVGTINWQDEYIATTQPLVEGVTYRMENLSPNAEAILFASLTNNYATSVPCFTRDVFIETKNGLVKVQDLKAGDLVKTLDHDLQPIRWVGSRIIRQEELQKNPKLRPIMIVAGALGNGLPERDLLVSRQHRMMVSSEIAERMTGSSEVLIPAIKLVALPGVYIDETVTEVEYFHVLFDQHEIIFAEGAETESLFVGEFAIKALGREALEEILAVFPNFEEISGDFIPARMIPEGKIQEELMKNIVNNKAITYSL